MLEDTLEHSVHHRGGTQPCYPREGRGELRELSGSCC